MEPGKKNIFEELAGWLIIYVVALILYTLAGQ